MMPLGAMCRQGAAATRQPKDEIPARRGRRMCQVRYRSYDTRRSCRHHVPRVKYPVAGPEGGEGILIRRK